MGLCIIHILTVPACWPTHALTIILCIMPGVYILRVLHIATIKICRNVQPYRLYYRTINHTVTTRPQSRHSDVVEPLNCIPGCTPYSLAQKLRKSIKLCLCSSEWDQTWNEDSQSNALGRNGEIFPNTRV